MGNCTMCPRTKEVNYKDLLQANYTELRERLPADDVIPHLFEHNIIELDEKMEIQEKAHFRQTELLLDTLIKKGSQQCQEFCSIVMEIFSDPDIQRLVQEGESGPHTDEAEVKYAEIIRQNYTELLRLLPTDELIPLLFQKGLITLREKQMIQKEIYDYKTQLLLDTMIRKGQTKCHEFCLIVRDICKDEPEIVRLVTDEREWSPSSLETPEENDAVYFSKKGYQDSEPPSKSGAAKGVYKDVPMENMYVKMSSDFRK